ncbi:MAG: hypothetical protein A2992_09280 [Elusimicrobia bacterium RIFCSPLOWO2_01_FULL_59_12]|nr:MAG: hypothetical protein A2992_09280 [Elusimicrobia bacterium RIFCSPLOWO2_01_FULL_59_12]
MKPFGNMTGIVLAGGRSSRFGADKAFAKLGGVPMIERALHTLRAIFGEWLVVTKTPELFCPDQARIVRDVGAWEGPLAGLYSGLLASSTERNFVCACDMPWLSPALIRRLCRAANGWEAVIPRVGNHLEPLCAVYSRRCLPVVHDLLQEGKRGLADLAARCSSKILPAASLASRHHLRRAFLDLDTPEDLARAERMAG